VSAPQAAGALLPVGEALTGAAAWLLPAAIALPWLGAAAVVFPGWRRRLPALAPWLAIPALVVAAGLAPGAESRLAWVFLDLRLTVDETGLAFLRFSSLIWVAAGVYARGYLRSDPDAWKFFAFYLVAAGGNAGLLLAGDLATFYLLYETLGLACYGLVVHNRDAAARRAARIYLAFVICGDALVFAALVSIARASGGLALPVSTPVGAPVLALLLAGFGVKLGMVPLHSWLPIAHPEAPVPASAVLSGVVIKCGLFGWLRFLPLGAVALPGWSTGLVLAGVIAALYAAAVGTVQRDAKTALAYSSVSQMGLIAVAVGLGLSGPDAWPAARFAIVLYATHHALTKCVLFLGIGVIGAARDRGARWATLGVLGVAAASLAGFPFTGGAAGKAALHAAELAARATSGLRLTWLTPLLSLGAAATAVLMGRTLWLAALSSHPLASGGPAAGDESRGARSSMLPVSVRAAWLGTAILMLMVPAWPIPLGAAPAFPVEPRLWSATWPVALGTAFVLLLWRGVWRSEGTRDSTIPPGDLLVPLARGIGSAARGVRSWGAHARSALRLRREALWEAHGGRHGRALRAGWDATDRFLRSWSGVGTLIALGALSLIIIWRLSGG